MIPLAHSARNGQSPQSYCAHVAGVVARASNNIKGIKPFIRQERADCYLEVATVAAIYHDLGKLAIQNQNVLNNIERYERLPIEHRDAGVKHLLDCNFEEPSATLIYAHHYPGLPNLMEQKTQGYPFRFSNAMDDSDKHLQEYLDLHDKEVGNVLDNISTTSSFKFTSTEYRMMLSCLVDADYSDTAGETSQCFHTHWEERLKKLDAYIQDLQRHSDGSQSERNALRNEFYDCCRNASTEHAVEYCDSPVGTGKTTAVMAHMLKMASTHGLRHIFVVLPYSNIISQTVEVLRNALVLDGEHPAEIVAEHHHQADFESLECRHLASIWNAPIIVTTAVQFFETIASNAPSKL